MLSKEDSAFIEVKEQFKGIYLSFIEKYNKGASHQEKDDLRQIGDIAIWEAVSSFNPEAGTKLSTHVYNTVRFKFLNSRGDHLGITKHEYQKLKSEDRLPKMIDDKVLMFEADRASNMSRMSVVVYDLKRKCCQQEFKILEGVILGYRVEDVCDEIGIKKGKGYYVLTRAKKKIIPVLKTG